MRIIVIVSLPLCMLGKSIIKDERGKGERECGREETKSSLLCVCLGSTPVLEPVVAEPVSALSVVNFRMRSSLPKHGSRWSASGLGYFDLHFPNQISSSNFRCGTQCLQWTSKSKCCFPSPSSAFPSHLCWFGSWYFAPG